MGINQKMPPHYALFLPLAKEPENSFLAHDPEIIFEEMAEIFRRFKIKKTFYIGEPFWQTEYIHQKTCLKLKIPELAANIYNLPLAAELVKKLKSEAIITTEKIFLAFKKQLISRGADSIRIWYFLGPINTETASEISRLWPSSKIFQQYSPFVAIPSGYQCSSLAGQTNIFHPSNRREMTISFSPQKEIIVTIKKPLLAKTLKYKTDDVGEFTKKKCPCGRKIFRVQV